MKKNVLVLNCGTLAATDLNMAMRFNKDYVLYGASSISNHGEFAYFNYINDIPNMNEDGFFDKLNDAIKKYNISFIIPAHDSLTLYCQENKDKINAVICCSPYETALLCRYKSKTYLHLKECNFVPTTYDIKDIEKIEYPVFIKKDDDQGGRNAFKINNKDELNQKYTDDMVICEYLPGEEVTVDCFTNKNGELLYCNPRAADRMLAGIDVRARKLECCEEIKVIGEQLNNKIKFRGVWFFQVKQDKNGKYKLLEISTRLPGAFSLSRGMDVNLPYYALQDFDNKDVVIDFNDYMIETDKQFFTKYKLYFEYNEVYISIDSLFFNGKINQYLMLYIYQCINNKHNINLIYKDEKELTELENNPISKKLFDKIIAFDDFRTIKANKDKVFISNNNLDRIEMRKTGFYSFETSIVEALIDWKM